MSNMHRSSSSDLGRNPPLKPDGTICTICALRHLPGNEVQQNNGAAGPARIRRECSRASQPGKAFMTNCPCLGLKLSLYKVCPMFQKARALEWTGLSMANSARFLSLFWVLMHQNAMSSVMADHHRATSVSLIGMMSRGSCCAVQSCSEGPPSARSADCPRPPVRQLSEDGCAFVREKRSWTLPTTALNRLKTQTGLVDMVLQTCSQAAVDRESTASCSLSAGGEKEEGHVPVRFGVERRLNNKPRWLL